MSEDKEQRPEWAEVVTAVEVENPIRPGMPSIAELLNFEERFEGRPLSKESIIRQKFGISPARYYALLLQVIETQAALEYKPMLVHRLLAERDRRRAERARRIDERTNG